MFAGMAKEFPFVGDVIVIVGGWLNTFVAPGVMPLANQFNGSLP